MTAVHGLGAKERIRWRLQSKVTSLTACAPRARLAWAPAGGAAAKSTHATAGVTVYAAASLTDVFPKIDGGNTYNFAGSNALATQITNGAPADVFASANTSCRRSSTRRGSSRSRSSSRGTRSSIVVPKANPAGIKSIYDLTKPGVKLDIANSAVPVGSYTLQV